MGYFVDVKHDTGIAYGDGFVQGDGVCGQVMKVVGDDLFAVADDPTEAAFGILYKDVKSGEMPTIYTGGGVYETDNFTGTIQAGERLKVHATNHNLTNGVQAGEKMPLKPFFLKGLTWSPAKAQSNLQIRYLKGRIDEKLAFFVVIKFVSHLLGCFMCALLLMRWG